MKRFFLTLVLLVAFVVPASATFPVVEGSATTSATPSDTSHTLNLPADIEAGDRLVAFIRHAILDVSIDGFTQTGTRVRSGVFQMSIFDKIATGAEGATVTATTSASTSLTIVIIKRYSNVSQLIPVQSSFNDSSASQPALPLVVTGITTNDTRFVVAGMKSSGSISGAPTNYTSFEGNSTFALATRELANVASEDPDTFVGSISANYITATVSIPSSDFDTSDFPKRKGDAAVTDSAANTTHSVNLPSDIEAGEWLEVDLAVEDAVDLASTPSGWTQQLNATRTTAVRYVKLVREASGSEGATLSVEVNSSTPVRGLARRIADTEGPSPGTTANGSNIGAFPPTENVGVSGNYLWSTVAVKEDPGGFEGGVGNPYINYAVSSPSANIASSERWHAASSENPPDTFDGIGSTSYGWVASTIAWQPEVPPSARRRLILSDVLDHFDLSPLRWFLAREAHAKSIP